MTYKQLLERLQRLSIAPEKNTEDLRRWIECIDVLEFFLDSTEGQVPMYISGPHFYLYSVLVKSDKLRGDYVEDLMHGNFGASSGWGYGWQNTGTGPKQAIFPPLDYTGTRILEGEEPIFFLRDFQGLRSYAEINQRLSHILGIHLEIQDDRHIYSRLDENGDFEEVATAEREGDFLICTLDCNSLDFYTFLTDTALIRLFDVDRFRVNVELVLGSARQDAMKSLPDKEIYARQTVFGSEGNVPMGSLLRGFQIVRRKRTDEAMMRVLCGEQQRQYVSFIAYDWKHRQVAERSCDPAHLGNYFVESDLPFETTPAFFKPDVLLKYKQDPDKYQIGSRTINCRGAWSLSYDINDEGQLFAYLIYLSCLPHSEQLYWRSFNEPPKSGISERAYKTDFLGSCDTQSDPLFSLKEVLQKFPSIMIDGQEMAIWVNDEDSFNRLTYVVTTSRKEWEDQILTLSKLMVEGLQYKTLRIMTERLGCYDLRLGSIKLLSNCLQTLGFAQELINEIIEPFEEVWAMRSAKIAHRGGQAKVKSNYKQKFNQIVERSYQATEKLAELIKNHRLDL